MCELSTNGKLWWCHVHLCFTGGCESIHHKVETLEEYAPECAHMYSRMTYNCIYLSIYLSPIYRFPFLPIDLSIHPCTYLSIQLREKKRDWIFSVCICKHGSSAYGVILVNPSNRFVRLCGPSASGRKCNFPKSLR